MTEPAQRLYRVRYERDGRLGEMLIARHSRDVKKVAKTFDEVCRRSGMRHVLIESRPDGPWRIETEWGRPERDDA